MLLKKLIEFLLKNPEVIKVALETWETFQNQKKDTERRTNKRRNRDCDQ
ncbi:hypothetical protein [Persephonella sp.]